MKTNIQHEIDEGLADLEGFMGELKDYINADALLKEAKAYKAGQATLLAVLKDEPIVPAVQIQTVEKAMRFHWQLTDYKAKGGTVHLRQKNFTMVVYEDGSAKRFKS